MKILFLTTVLPGKKRGGGELVSQGFIETLLESHQVSVIGYQRQNDEYELAPYEYSAGQRFIETESAGWQRYVWLLQSFIHQQAYSVTKYISKGYISTLNQLSPKSYDIVILDHAQMGWLMPYLDKFILLTHNVEYQLYKQQTHNSTGPQKILVQREARRIKVIEDQTVTKAQQVWTLTNHDSAYFSNYNTSTIAFEIPSRLKPQPSHAVLRPSFDLGLLGTWTWQANLEGLKWFLQEVCPLLPSHLSIHIAGKGTEGLHVPPNVYLRGFVPDATTFLQEARVIAIPSVQGGGIQIKTLDAIAVGSRIVTTSIALRGIDNYPAGLLVADTAPQFAEGILRSLQQTQTHDLIAWSEHRRHEFQRKLKDALANLS